ncbi:hypothetical protein AB0D04_07445 [Streptomyces sp. NPDC048483]|uniref:hypothetical protein n=1 Tax=Streptomyces sp. NPDC048483 TaxID=3154927 RepID=UPI00343C4899
MSDTDHALDGHALDGHANGKHDTDEPAEPGYCLAPGGVAYDGPAGGPPYADCVLCGKPTEYPADRPGIVLCPVCEWQEAQRSACSG